MRFLAFGIFILFSLPATADDGFFSRLCGPVVNEMARARAAYVKACQQELESLGCDKYFSENFVPAAYRRDCNDPPGTLSNSSLQAMAWCPVEFGTGVAMGDLIFDPLMAAYKAMSDEGILEEESKPRLTKSERAEKYRQAIREQVDYLSLPYEEKLKMWEAAEADQTKRKAAEETLKNWINSAGIALGCYNDRKYKELICYGAGAAVGTVGIVKGAKYLGKLASKGAGKLGEWGEKIFRAAGISKAPPGQTAEFLAAATAKVESKLGYKPNVSAAAEARADFVAIEATHPEFTSTLAKITGDVVDGGKTVRHLDIKVLNDNNFEKGLSGLMLAEMLQRYPKITKISTQLTGVNQKEVIKNMNKGMTCLEAIMASPSFKIRRDAGFTKFVGEPICERAKGVFHYTVERP